MTRSATRGWMLKTIATLAAIAGAQRHQTNRFAQDGATSSSRRTADRPAQCIHLLQHQRRLVGADFLAVLGAHFLPVSRQSRAAPRDVMHKVFSQRLLHLVHQTLPRSDA